MTRWRGPDVPDGVRPLGDGGLEVHLSARVITVTPGSSGMISVPEPMLDELLELAGYTRLDDTEETSP